jgi:hypothetical protein
MIAHTAYKHLSGMPGHEQQVFLPPQKGTTCGTSFGKIRMDPPVGRATVKWNTTQLAGAQHARSGPQSQPIVSVDGMQGMQ